MMVQSLEGETMLYFADVQAVNRLELFVYTVYAVFFCQSNDWKTVTFRRFQEFCFEHCCIDAYLCDKMAASASLCATEGT